MNLDQMLITGGTMVIVAIVGYIASQVVKMLETGEVYLSHWLDGVTNNNGTVAYNAIVEYASLMVRAAYDKAQSEGWDGEQKLEYATDKVYDFIVNLKNQGVVIPITITRENVESLVRGAYQEVANWLGEFEPGTSQLE